MSAQQSTNAAHVARTLDKGETELGGNMVDATFEPGERVLLLTVKGNGEQALDAAQRRGFYRVRLRPRQVVSDYSGLVVPATSLPLVVTWYTEPDIRPFPAGTLMLYSEWAFSELDNPSVV